MTEFSAITGLHKAVIGVSTRNGVDKVLVYDRIKAKNLLFSANWTEERINMLFDKLTIENLGDLAPIFVYLDRELFDGIVDRPTVH